MPVPAVQGGMDKSWISDIFYMVSQPKPSLAADSSLHMPAAQKVGDFIQSSKQEETSWFCRLCVKSVSLYLTGKNPNQQLLLNCFIKGLIVKIKEGFYSINLREDLPGH